LVKTGTFDELNEHGAHVDLQSVEFCLSKQCKFVEYSYPTDGTIQKVHTDVGYSLSFSFKNK